MTRSVLVAIPLVALVALVAGARMHVLAAALVTGAAVIIAVWLTWGRSRRNVRRMAARINAWLGSGERERVEPRGGRAWRELAIAVNAVGAALDRARGELDRAAPWRREVVDALVTPALLFDADDRLLAANPTAREELRVGDEPVTIMQAVGSAPVADAATEARTTGRGVSVDATVGGRELRIDVAPVGEELLVLVSDRSRERRVEDVRRNFVVNASHELKTPAASIQALADALEVAVTKDPERMRALVSRLGEEAARLNRVVHDLLDLRRLEESAPSAREPVDLAAVVRSTVAEHVDRADERGVTLSVEAPDRAVIVGARDDVGLIVRNLVSNAIQYNREGGRVDLSVTRRRGGYELVVADTGIGIPQQDLQRIFERFYRVDVERSRDSGGTGLGLAIVRHAVERHGGRIQVDSLLGEGTTFTVTLPVEPPG